MDLSPSAWSSYKSLPEPRNAEADTGTCYVDYGKPNAWGIYLVYNNLYEWCLNRQLNIAKDEECHDKGTAPVGTGDKYTHYRCKGASKGNYSGLAVSGSNYFTNIRNESSVRYGARVCLTIP